MEYLVQIIRNVLGTLYQAGGRVPCDRRAVYVRLYAGAKAGSGPGGAGMDTGIPDKFFVPKTVFSCILYMHDAVPNPVLQIYLGKSSG